MGALPGHQGTFQPEAVERCLAIEYRDHQRSDQLELIPGELRFHIEAAQRNPIEMRAPHLQARTRHLAGTIPGDAAINRTHRESPLSVLYLQIVQLETRLLDPGAIEMHDDTEITASIQIVAGRPDQEGLQQSLVELPGPLAIDHDRELLDRRRAQIHSTRPRHPDGIRQAYRPGIEFQDVSLWPPATLCRGPQPGLRAIEKQRRSVGRATRPGKIRSEGPGRTVGAPAETDFEEQVLGRLTAIG